jgi:hypothetical protein
MESLFEGEVLMTSLFDEFTHGVQGFGTPWFEPFRVMQNEKAIIWCGEFSFYVRFSRFPVLNSLSQQPTQLVAGNLWS